MNIAGYVTTEKLHDGDNSVVFRALRLSDNLPVVLKLSPREYPSPRELIRFRHEHLILGHLDTPRVVKGLGLEQAGHRPMLIVEDVGGTSLSILLDTAIQPGMTLEGRLGLCLMLAQAVGEVHDAHVVHKDLIPDNILCTPGFSRLCLIDFGIAILDVLTMEDLEQSGQADMLEGHLSHISPEQAGMTPHGGGDWRSDLYAMGVTFFQILTGELPFSAADPLALLHRHLAAPPPLAHERNPDLPAVVSKIIQRLMAKAPEERYQSALGVAADLERLLDAIRRGAVPDFPLGNMDRPQHFSVPQTLYGRSGDLERLAQAFARCADGPSELVLVTGAPGIGKTALIRQLHPLVVARDGLFIEGKFDQLQRGTPFLGLAQALQDLVRQIVGRGLAEMELWKERILAAVGSNGRIMVELAPDMELIIGPQPEIPRLGQMESLNRFNLVLGAFLKALRSRERPLVIFLDDLQWADTPSLQLLELLMHRREEGHILFLGAYRDNEVGPNHPLRRILETMEERGSPPGSVALGPLSGGSVRRLVAETLVGSGAVLEEKEDRASLSARLARLLLDKTGGNPFFLRQYLVHLHAQGVIHRPRGARAWTCDPDRVVALGVSDNVALFIAERMRQLPDGAQRLLRLAGCLGNIFDLEILALVWQTEESTVQSALIPAIRAGLVLPHAGAFSIRDVTMTLHQEHRHFRFLHDRVQQAAYALVPEEERPSLHLHIGRILRGRLEILPMEERGKLPFEVADHLNLGRSLIVDRDERLDLVHLNLAAGMLARESAAFEASLEYYQQAGEALPPEAWERERDLAFQVHVELTRALSWAGRHEQAVLHVEQGLPLARTPLERAQLLRILVNQHTLLGELPQALVRGVEALRLLGLDVPESDEEMARRADELLPILRQRLGSMSVDEIEALPELTDPEYRAIIEVGADLAGPASMANHALWRLLVLDILAKVLDFGHSSEALGSYICFANMAVLMERNYDIARRNIEMCQRLMLKFPDRYYDSIYTAMISFHIEPWTLPMQEALASARVAERMSRENGCFVYTGFLCVICSSRIFITGGTLQQVMQELEAEEEAILEIKHSMALDMIRGLKLVTANLMGLTPSWETYSYQGLDESSYLENRQDIRDLVSVVTYDIFKALALIIYGRRDQALPLLDHAASAGAIYVGSCFTSVRIFLQALLLGGMDPRQLSEEERARREDCLSHMDLLATAHPGNFLGNSCLARAEAARVEGRELEAADFYDRAIAANRDNGFIQFQAMACELAGLFWQGRGNELVARTYLREARYLYAMWGAKHKVRLMDAAYGPLIGTSRGETEDGARRLDTPLAVDTDHTSILDRRAVDLAAIMKSARSISEEIELEFLLPRLLTIMCEHAGATRGVYFDVRNEELIPRALFSGDDAAAPELPKFSSRLLDDRESGTFMDYARSVVSLTVRKGEPVVVEDMGADKALAKDPHMHRHRPGSVLCLPVMRTGKVRGALYFENDLTPGVFSRSIVPALETLAAQAAVSLENAALYSGLRRAEHRYRSLFENSMAGIYQTSPDGRILMANPAAAAILGYDDPEDLLASVRSLEQDFYLNPADREKLLARLAQGVVEGFEVQARTKGGGTVWVSVNARGQYDAAGNLVRVEGFLEDISRRKQDEERILRLSHELMRIQEAERGRLSRELHDQLAQNLLAMKLHTYILSQRLGGQEGGVIEKLEAQLSDSIESVRHLSHMLRPPNLELFGMKRAIENLCAVMTNEKSLEVSCSLPEDGEMTLTREAQTNLYRLVQETLQNVLKHADARRFSVEMTRTDATLQVRMQDNGRGFDVASRMRQAMEDKHLGLLGMQERARLLGSELQIGSEPGKGTLIALDIPL